MPTNNFIDNDRAQAKM